MPWKAVNLPFHQMLERIRAGDKSALACAITLVEQRAPERIPLLRGLFPFTGGAQIIGITGAPGSGKSTLIAQAIRAYRQQQKRVGVIAVDPTTPYSGGSTLGDRVRIQNGPGASDAFIRSMANRGRLGSIAPATADVATLLDASGKNRILIETAGTGEDELDIMSVTDVLVALAVPGTEDDLPMGKAGLMEAADIFVINKSDRDGVNQLEAALRESLALNRRPDNWRPRIIKTVASTGEGVADMIAAVDAYFQFLQQHNLALSKAIAKWQVRLLQMVREHLTELLLGPEYGPLFEGFAVSVAERQLDPYTVMERLTGIVTGGSSASAKTKTLRAS
jgi:LAO/AO transport system kinase